VKSNFFLCQTILEYQNSYNFREKIFSSGLKFKDFSKNLLDFRGNTKKSKLLFSFQEKYPTSLMEMEEKGLDFKHFWRLRINFNNFLQFIFHVSFKSFLSPKISKLFGSSDPVFWSEMSTIKIRMF